MSGASRARSLAPALVLLALALVSPVLAPRSPWLQEDPAGARYLPPLTRARAVPLDDERVWIVTGLAQRPDGWRGWRGKNELSLPDGAVERSTARLYVLGTDALGRDNLSRLLHGLRHSFAIATVSVALALLVGIGIGATAGLAGGWRDSVLMRGTDVVLAVPRLLVFLLAAALSRPSTALLVAVLGLTTWPGVARLVRGEMLALRTSDMALAARAAGCTRTRLLVSHLLPEVAPIVTVAAALRFGDTILLESALAFLGLGSPPPAVSLGAMVAAARDGLAEAWWAALAPGLLIVVLVLAVRATASGWQRASEPPSVL